jgi:hypothetical protein
MFPFALGFSFVERDSKADRVVCAEEMIRVLDNNARTGFKYLLTGDESWMHSDQSPTKMLALDREYVEQKLRPTNYQRKTMIFVFFGVDGIALLDMLSQGWKLTSVYFKEHIIRALAVEKYPEARKIGTPRCILHFDHAPIHNTEKVGDTVIDCDFLRLEHPPYSADSSPCNFYLFGYLREKMRLLS